MDGTKSRRHFRVSMMYLSVLEVWSSVARGCMRAACSAGLRFAFLGAMATTSREAKGSVTASGCALK